MDSDVQQAMGEQFALLLNLVFALVKSGAIEGEALARPLDALASAADRSSNARQAKALRTMAEGARRAAAA